MGRNRVHRALIAAIVAGTAFSPAAFAQKMEEASMALPALTIGFSPTYIADAQGLWTKRGLKVTLHDIVGIGSMNAVLAGSIDFSNSSGPTIIRANIRGQKVLGIASTLDGLPFELLVRKDLAKSAGITEKSPVEKRAQLLKGKKVSLTSVNTIPHVLLRYFLEKGGLNPERDVTVVSMPPEAGIAALKAGTVDGYIQGVPWPLIAMREANAVPLSSPIRGDLPEVNPFAFNIVVTRPEVCEKRPGVCQKLIDGYTEAMQYMHEHPKQSVEILAKKMPKIDRAILEESFELTLKWTPKTARINDQGMVHAQDLMVTGGMIKAGEKLKSFDGIVTNKYAK
jgi:NitT/TauT family transport system substrate-binding protein